MRCSMLSPVMLALALALVGCGHTAVSPLAASQGRFAAQSSFATYLDAAAVPSDVVKAIQGPAQQAVDESSKRRGIDTFSLFANPVGLRLGSGPNAGYVLSFLGTAQHDPDLNVELRATYGAGKVGLSYNYSGPTTLGATAIAPPSLSLTKDAPTGVTFELLTGLPGNGVSDAYSDYLDHLAPVLQERYNAQDFKFDDSPLVFAVHEGNAVPGFVFCDQTNRLVLGERKYADVQNVAFVSADADVTACYTLIGFNRKTPNATTPPKYKTERDDRFGAFVQFGQL